jgi:dienelactone hydrolase
MNAIIVSDIFGRTPELEDIAVQLSSNSSGATIVDPYEGKFKEFKNEEEAYTNFQQTVGIERYKEYILKVINHSKSDFCLIGFSVGASAIWALSEEIQTYGNVKAICFYGSQIRNYLNVNPKIKIELFFPEHELHFDVANLISQLSRKTNVKCYAVPYQHGFMNKKSYNFNDIGYYNYLQLLKEKAA